MFGFFSSKAIDFAGKKGSLDNIKVLSKMEQSFKNSNKFIFYFMLLPKNEHIEVITSLMKHETKKETIIFESVSRFICTKKPLALAVYELGMKLVSKSFLII